MENDGDMDASMVAQAVLNAYAALPAKGKPAVASGEWTVLAGFVAVYLGNYTVLSLGTGTKCLPHTKVDPRLLSDMHAEVVARRALLLRLASGRPLAGDTPLWDGQKWNHNVRVVLFTSKEPCGSSRVVHSAVDGGENPPKRVKAQEELFVAIRKPGKGTESLCRSCADKITKWAGVDLFGSTGHAMMPGKEAPPLHTLIVGGSFPSEALFRALIEQRCPQLRIVRCDGVVFSASEEAFGCCAEELHPSGYAINWIGSSNGVEVCQPNGKLMGATRGANINPKHMSRLCNALLRVADPSMEAIESINRYRAARTTWERDRQVHWREQVELPK